MVNDLLAERQKTHGDFYDVAMTAQTLKDAMRRGKNWKVLDDTQRETLEMIASKIGRILAGNPHEPDHWRDVAGYATLIERALTACNASECDPTPRPAGCSPATPAPSPAASVWPMSPEEEEREVAARRG
jgi:hypothetical protein